MLFPPLNPPTPTFLDGIGNYVLLFAGLSAITFVLFYGLGSNWRGTPGGRAVFFFVSALAVVFAYSIFSRFLGGDFPGRDIIRLVIYSYVLITTIHLLVDLIRTQHNGNYRRDHISLLTHFRAWLATKKAADPESLPDQDREKASR